MPEQKTSTHSITLTAKKRVYILFVSLLVSVTEMVPKMKSPFNVYIN